MTLTLHFLHCGHTASTTLDQARSTSVDRAEPPSMAAAAVPPSPVRQPADELGDLFSSLGPPPQSAPAASPVGFPGSSGATAGWSLSAPPVLAMQPQPTAPLSNGSAVHMPIFPHPAQRPQQSPLYGGMGTAMGMAGGGAAGATRAAGSGGGLADGFDFDLTRQRPRGGQGMAQQRGPGGAGSMGMSGSMQSDAGSSSHAAHSSPYANGVPSP